MMTRLLSLGIAFASVSALQPLPARRAFLTAARAAPARTAPAINAITATPRNAPVQTIAPAATLRKKAAARVLGGLVAAASLVPGAALAKGGGYGASSAPSSSSYSSSSYSSAPMRSYAAPARTVVIRQPTRSYYVGGGGPVVVRPPNVLDYALPVAFTGLAVASVLGGEEREGVQRRRRSGGLALYAQELSDVKSLMRTLEKDFDASKAAVQRPVSGQYCGDSAEDDDGNQAVVSNLKFGVDGSITGDGIDGVDGTYTLAGRWAGDRCAWIERYGDGFEVAVTGTVERSGDIFILFCSSRGISGSADLRLRTAA